MKILIIRLSAIGDTIHCLPVASFLRSRIPGVQLAWMVEPLAAPLLIGNPAIDQVYVLPKEKWKGSIRRPWQWQEAITEIGALFSTVRREEFDVALEMQGLLKSAICAVASGAKRRIGFAQAREGSSLLLTDRVDVGDYFGQERHIVGLNLAVAKFMCEKLSITGSDGEPKDATNPLTFFQNDLGNLEFPLPESPMASVQKMDLLLGEFRRDDQLGCGKDVPLVALVTGTTWPSKTWPWQKWCQLAKLLFAKFKCCLCLVGGKNEIEKNKQILLQLQEELPSGALLDLTNRTDLLDLVYVFRRCQLVVGQDSGPLHLAAAVNRPQVVGIYGSTAVGRLGPYGAKSKAVALSLWCQPCHKKVCPLSTTACLKQLDAELVFEQICSLI